MKRILKAVALSLLLVSGSLLQNTATAQYYNDDYDQDREVSYQTFYDELSPHGRWIDYPGHGYVWIPDAGPDFRPYSTKGHWVWTDNYEWMWVSDYDWGWAPFHYGRWDYDSYYGWYWVPGYEWSSAWVAWRDGGDYYGWAPIRPGISININFNIGGYAPPVDFWCFAPRRYITSPRIYDYYIPRHNNVTIINQTTIIVNNYRYGNSYGFRSGPRRYDAERYCGRINPVRFRDSYNPGRTIFRDNEVSVYRPRVRQDNNRQYSPRSFERYDRNSNTGFRNRDNDQNNNNNGNADNNRRFDRRNDGTRQQQDNNGTVDNNRRFDRRNSEVRNQDNGNGNNNSNDRRRFDRNDNSNGNREKQPIERRVEPRDQSQNNNGNGNNERRRFDRSTDQPQRQPQQMERRQEQRTQPQSTERRFERPQQERRQQPQSTERRFERPQQQQMERRQEQRQQPQQQMERRQEQRQQPQQQQRQFERRDNGNSSQQGSNNSGRGNGNGRGRRS